MSWNRDRYNREDDDRERNFRNRGQQWDRDFDSQNYAQNNQQYRQVQGRGFEGDYGYRRDFDYERGMNAGNQGRYYGGSDYGQGMGNDFSQRGSYGQGQDFGRGNRGDWSQNPNFGYDRQNDWNQDRQFNQFNSGYNRDYDYGSAGFQGNRGMNQGQLRGGWPGGGDYDYSRHFDEGDWSSSPTRRNYGAFGSSTEGNFGRGFYGNQSRNWGQGQPDFNRDFGNPYQSSGFGYDYDQAQREFGSSYGPSFGASYGSSFGRGFSGNQGQGSFGGNFGGSQQNRQWNQGPHSGRGPQGWQRSDDRIREDINEALTHHGWLDATNIQVEVSGGTVTLNGTVESRYAKRMAEDALESVSGVRDVQNNLRVQMGDEGRQAHNESFGSTSGMSQGTGTSSGTSGRSTSSTGTTNRTKERSTT